jgi:glycosyltransferase involved in cell wall biosynthesis
VTEAECRARIAVVSPFLDKSHGTERIIIEWMSRLDRDFEFHVYSQHVEDVDLSGIVWHRIPRLPGAHLLNYLWWFGANHLWRAWHRRFRGLAYDVVFSPGVNCLDADVISVHIVFREFVRRVHSELKLLRNPVWFWPRVLHRRLYYGLISFLEKRTYTNPETTLIVIAKKTLGDLDRLYRRRNGCVLVYLGLDHATYNPVHRAELRETSRAKLGIPADRLQLLMVGNDWHKKGIRVLIEAVLLLRDLPIDLLVAGRDEAAPFQSMAAEKGLGQRVRFLPPRKDVEFYYAAADIYAGPSLEDTFALPPVEAMACGLPVIVSRENGAYEIMTDGADGFILDDPADANSLAAIIRKLYDDPELCARVGSKATETARQFNWEQNARDLATIFQQVIRRKSQPDARTLTQEL